MFENLFAERGLSLDRLKVLIEVRDAGSNAQAAPGDPVRQSQYSRQLRELSEFFGCEVAQRRGKILKLTTADGPFTGGLREIAKSFNVSLRPALACQSFPQTMAALRSGRFWAIVPEIAARDVPSTGLHRLPDPLLRHLDREAMLAWNPRLVRVRPNAAKIAARLQTVLAL